MLLNRVKYCLIAILALALFRVSSFTASGQSADTDYITILSNHWQAAENWFSNNEFWIRPELEKYNIQYNEAVAVVFPEVVRFSMMRESRDLPILKALYVNNGKAFADFSMGILRMKPSFAEAVRYELSLIPDSRLQKILKRRSGYMDDRKYRAMIVEELEDIREQILYVAAYILLYENKPGMPDGEARIRLLAAAYNDAPLPDSDGLRMKADEKIFGTNHETGEKYFYCDISLFWYRMHLND